MKYITKILLLLLLSNFQILFANNISQEALNKATIYYEKREYKEALKWLKVSYEEEISKEAAFNFGLTYKKLKEYPNAIKWYKKAFELGDTNGGVNLGLLYKKNLQNFTSAIKWYKKAFSAGDIGGAYNLGILYEDINNVENSIKWYKKSIKKGHLDSYDNIALIYHDIKKDDITASAYYLATIGKSYTKKEIIDFLKNDWKIDEVIIKKAYHLQKTLVPNPYYDEEFEDKAPKKKRTGRR